MGLVMKEVRGRADGKIVNQILRRELEKFLEKL
jgi:Glu-tRNA(Gln) amidotransferase subunit E-like FAD-binding protein